MDNPSVPIIKKIGLESLEELRTISLATFTQSFYHLNSPEDFDHYVSNAFAKDKLKEEIENPLTHFYFVYRETELIGYFKINLDIDAYEQPDQESMELQRIYVNQDRQSAGTGQEILNFIFKLGRDMRYKSIWLGVWNQNKRAIRFYEKNGFTRIGEHPFLLGQDLQTDDLYQIYL